MKDILDILLDADNKDPIPLADAKGRTIAFEQIAVIPFDKNGEEVLYAVLKPIDKMDGVADDEGLVFFVDEDSNGNKFLKVELDELTAIEVFNKYYDLFENAHKKH